MLPFFESRNSPITFYNGFIGRFPPHFHIEVELFYLMEGTAEIEISGNRKTLHAGDIAVIFPNEIHEYIGNTHNRNAIIIFDPMTCTDFFSHFTNFSAVKPFIENRAQSGELKDAMTNLLSILSSDSDVPTVLIKGYLTILLYHIFNCISTERKSSVDNSDIAAQVINYISLHYLEQINLESVSVALGYSKYEISRVFSKKIGIHFNEYLNSRRAEHAVMLLSDTSNSITEIAFASGFESLRTFYRVFSNKYNISPMKYRMNNNTT